MFAYEQVMECGLQQSISAGLAFLHLRAEQLKTWFHKKGFTKSRKIHHILAIPPPYSIFFFAESEKLGGLPFGAKGVNALILAEELTMCEFHLSCLQKH